MLILLIETDWEDFKYASIFIFVRVTSVELLDLFVFLYLKLELGLLRSYCCIIVIVKRCYPRDKFYSLLELSMC